MSHDASLSVFKGDTLVFAAHSERYSRIKNDKELHPDLIYEALQFGEPSSIYFYENHWIKRTRQIISRQFELAFKKKTPKQYLLSIADPYLSELFSKVSVKLVDHHRSHAAAGYYTSPFQDATVLCVDSIGEWDTATIWTGKGTSLTRRESQRYPHSLGLWYSSMTQRIGLKPQEDEYILMGMAAAGNPDHLYDIIKRDFFSSVSDDPGKITLKNNLHRGCTWWRPHLRTVQDLADIAAATQKLYEDILIGICKRIATKYPSKNLVLMGGCALNCVANAKVRKYFDNIWIMPNPGDAGSSIGAVLAKKKAHIDFHHAFLGQDIPGEYPVNDVVDELINKKVAAVAAGRAEFGPRALGHRSLLADPRDPDIKDRVNSIKQRQSFRPFAPMILQEDASTYFEVPDDFSSPYMQYAVKCRYPQQFPSIVHIDGSSRIQTVTEDTPDIHNLLIKWKEISGCPMLLNTSLNIRGEPLVNSRSDAIDWQKNYGVSICLPK